MALFLLFFYGKVVLIDPVQEVAAQDAAGIVAWEDAVVEQAFHAVDAEAGEAAELKRLVAGIVVDLFEGQLIA